MEFDRKRGKIRKKWRAKNMRSARLPSRINLVRAVGPLYRPLSRLLLHRQNEPFGAVIARPEAELAGLEKGASRNACSRDP